MRTLHSLWAFSGSLSGPIQSDKTPHAIPASDRDGNLGSETHKDATMSFISTDASPAASYHGGGVKLEACEFGDRGDGPITKNDLMAVCATLIARLDEADRKICFLMQSLACVPTKDEVSGLLSEASSLNAKALTRKRAFRKRRGSESAPQATRRAKAQRASSESAQGEPVIAAAGSENALLLLGAVASAGSYDGDDVCPGTPTAHAQSSFNSISFTPDRDLKCSILGAAVLGSP